MKIISYLLFAIFLPLFLVACTPEQQVATEAPTQTPYVLTVARSGGTTRVLRAIEAAFEADTPGYELELLSGTGTGGGVRGIIDGQWDVAAMARLPKDDEAIEYVQFGQSGVAAFTHADVGVTDLTSDQLIAIFSGDIINWSEVGGPDVEILLFVRDEADSSTNILREAIIGSLTFSESAQIMTSFGDMLGAVERSLGSIGYDTWPSVMVEGANVQGIILDGVAFNDPAYPMLKPIGIGFLADRQSDVQPLIAWLLSSDGQAALQAVGVTPLES